MSEVAPRLDRVLRAMGDAGCERLLAVGAGHGLHLCSYSRYFSGPVAVIVDADGARTLVVPAYELEAAQEHAKAERVEGYGPRTLGMEPDPFPLLVDACAGLAGGGRLGTASEHPGIGEAVASAAGATAVSMDGALHDVRLVKDAEERAAVAHSFALALAGQAEVERLAVPGAREIDLFAGAQARALALAGRPAGFVSDLLAGSRSALVGCPVGVAGEHELAAGDVVVSDVAVGDGYWGDSARTYTVGGAHPDAGDVRAGIESVLDELAAMLRPGAICEDIFLAAERMIGERFPDGVFPHHAGHGVGITVFEDPHLIPGDRTPLEVGMVLAVEPGVYFPDRFGVRVENTYAVTERGGAVL